jgi:hypothetical protein
MSLLTGNRPILGATTEMSPLTGNRPILRATTEMSLLTGPPDSTGGCHGALVDKLGVGPSRYHPPRSTSVSPGDSTSDPRPQC